MTSPQMVTVNVSGPLFDGRAAAAVTDLCDEIEYSVAWQAHAEARQIMDASFRQPTPYYEVQVTVEPRGDEMVVHDRGIVYGPWLVRGRPGTRFRGYDMYRKATAAVLPQVGRLVQHLIGPFLRRMNGG
jgi:hypothetical protein